MYKTSKYTLLKTIKTLEKPTSFQCYVIVHGFELLTSSSYQCYMHLQAIPTQKTLGEKPSSTQCYMHLKAIFKPTA